MTGRDDNVVPLRRRGNVRTEATGEPSPATSTPSGPMAEHVREAMQWLRSNSAGGLGRPRSDYLDAAYAVAGRSGGQIGFSGWPEFVACVRAAAEGRMPIPEPEQEVDR